MFGILIFNTLARPKLGKRNNQDKTNLQNEDAPAFRELDKLESRFDIKDRYRNVFEVIDTTAGNRKDREFFHCILSLNGISIQNSYAFGSGISLSSGGALFISSSTLKIVNSLSDEDEISNNVAGTGGAIAGLDVCILLEGCKINSNTAFMFAGAIYSSAVNQVIKDEQAINVFAKEDSSFYMIDCEVISNKAVEFGGALFVQYHAFSYFERIKFGENLAGSSGGAVYACKTEAKFFRCIFSDNFAGKRTDFSLFNSASQKYISNTRYNHQNHARSGGAIFCNANSPEESEMYTQECCFAGNQVIEVSNLDPGQLGQDVHLMGNVVWNSLYDTFKGGFNEDNELQRDKILSFNKNFPTSEAFFWHPKSENENPTCVSTNERNTNQVPEGDPPRPNELEDIDYAMAVVEPTEYIFVATPITRLPYATTMSHMYTKGITWNIVDEFVVETFSLAPTPEATASQSASLSVSPTASLSVSPTPSISVSPTPSLSVSPTPSLSISPTPSLSISPSPSLSVSPSPSLSVSPTPSLSVSPTPSLSVSPSPSLSISPSPSHSVSPTPTLSVSPTATASESVSPTTTPSLSISPTPTPSESVSATMSPSLSVSPTASPTLSVSPTPSLSVSPSASVSISPSPTESASPSLSVSATPSVSVSCSASPSVSMTPEPTPAYSPWPTATASPSSSPSESHVPTVSVSPSPSPSPSVSPTSSPSYSVSQTASLSVSPSPSLSVSPTPTISVSPTPSYSVSATPTQSIPATQTPSAWPTPSASAEPTPSASQSPSQSPSSTPSFSVSGTPSLSLNPTTTPSPNPTQSLVPTVSQSVNPTQSQSLEPTASQSLLPTVSQSFEPTQSLNPTPSQSFEPTASQSLLPTISQTFEPTQSLEPSASQSLNPTPSQSLKPSASLKATVSQSLNPTASESPNPSISVSASMSPIATASMLIPLTSSKEGRETIVTTLSASLTLSNILSHTMSKSLMQTIWNEELSFTWTDVHSLHGSHTASVTYVVYEDVSWIEFVDDGDNKPESSILPIVLGVVGAVLLVIIAVVLVYFVVIRKKQSRSESSSTLEMVEDDDGLFGFDAVTKHSNYWTEKSKEMSDDDTY